MGCYMSSFFFLCLLISLFFQSQFTYSSSSPSLPSFNSSLTQLCSRHDYFALLQFKNSLTMYNFSYYYCDVSIPKTNFWKEGTDCCTWNGVTCDKMMGYVIGLDLSCSLINTTLHSNSSLFLLRHLRRLNLAYNDFNFTPIPSQIGRLTGLTHLNLSNSNLGQIPSELSHLSKLVSLDFSYLSNFETKIGKHQFESLVLNLTDLRELILTFVDLSTVDPYSMKNLSSSLTSLRLSSCGMHGNLPENIVHLPNLYELDLSENGKLNYYFPSVNWTSPLRILDLGYTSFSDKLWNSIGNLPKDLTYLDLAYTDITKFPYPLPVHLSHLDLSQNQLTDLIPSSITNLTRLVFLDLCQNNIAKFPYPLSVHLSYLDLSQNQLTGLIPYSLFVPLLTYIDLSQNQLTGLIPYPLFVPLLTHIDLSQNQLTGLIPSSITNLTRLVYLDLSYNKLAGSIPSGINWPRPNLTDLILNDNELNGTLPSWFYHISSSSLTTLNLRSNRLTGHINEFQYRTLTFIDLRNNEFQGPIPTSILEQVNLTQLYLSSNNFSGRVNFEKMFSKLNNLFDLDLSRNNLSIETDNFINNLTLPSLLGLRLASCNLSEFPNFLKSLVKRHLAELDLSNNKIGGLIPKDFGEIRTLDLSHNLLEGFDQSSSEDPSFIGMTFVDLQSNRLQGSLPVLSGDIQSLSVANKLSGVFPPSICNMTGLELLDLSNNFFSGSIPPCLGSFNSSLSVLNLGRNCFHGPMPQIFEPGCRLQTFDVSENQLEGSIPRSLANCKELDVLNLGKNNIVDTFPIWLDFLPELQVLVLKSNRFHGPILSQQQKRISSFCSLNVIDLSYNNFIGNIPPNFFERLTSMVAITDSKSETLYLNHVGSYYDSMTFMYKGREMRFVRILTTLKAVDFSNNHFEGHIPKSLGNLKSLRILNFSSNDFTGPIPSSFGNLSELESLDLSKNKLSGEIPTQLTGLTFLSHFDVSQNHLVGTIPRGKQFETFLNTSYEKNTGLCGPPLSKKCGNTEEPPSPPSTSEDNQSSYKFGSTVYDWIVVAMGYVSGLVIRLAGGIFIFDKKKAWFMKILGMKRHQRGK